MSADAVETLEDLIEALPEEEQGKIVSSPRFFAETLLVTPETEEPFVANYIQRQILDSRYRFNVIRVHRRSGKSYSLSVLALFYALTRSSCDVLLVAPYQEQVQLVFETIREFVRVNAWIEGYITQNRGSPSERLRFSNGSQISGKTAGTKQKSKGASLRGQGADLILIDEAAFLSDEDWETLNPIIKGDKYRKNKPRVFAASTPPYTRGAYYTLCKDPEKKKYWKEFQMSVTENPDWTEQDVLEARATCSSEVAWTREWLAEFPEVGAGVFAKKYVDQARRTYSYIDYKKRVEQQSKSGVKIPPRTIGVDWDKHNQDGAGSNIVVLEKVDRHRYRLIYREEIEQAQFTLRNAVQRVIELNDLFNPQWIYIDRGNGEYQLEEFQAYGQQFPRTGFLEKIVGVQFAEVVIDPLPNGGFIKKRFKEAMVGLLTKWFEEQSIEIPIGDNQLIRQLIEYHVVSKTDNSIKYVDKNDHIIAAMGLAAMAMHHKVTQPYTAKPATESYIVPVPEAIPTDQPSPRLTGRTPLEEFYASRGEDGVGYYSRESLGRSDPFSRSSF